MLKANEINFAVENVEAFKEGQSQLVRKAMARNEKSLPRLRFDPISLHWFSLLRAFLESHRPRQ
jgi:hypothetical protein